MMKKIIICLFTALLPILLISCSGKTEKNEEANYVIVKMENDTKVNDLFEFKSVSKTVLDSEFSQLDMEDGCYCIGVLVNGNSIVWRSDDDGYGYDDCLFIYVEDEISDAQIVTYAVKLKETPISYDSFKEKYEL